MQNKVLQILQLLLPFHLSNSSNYRKSDFWKPSICDRGIPRYTIFIPSYFCTSLKELFIDNQLPKIDTLVKPFHLNREEANISIILEMFLFSWFQTTLPKNDFDSTQITAAHLNSTFRKSLAYVSFEGVLRCGQVYFQAVEQSNLDNSNSDNSNNKSTKNFAPTRLSPRNITLRYVDISKIRLF